MNNELVQRPVGGLSSTLRLHVGIVRINFVVEKIIVDQSKDCFECFFNFELAAVVRKFAKVSHASCIYWKKKERKLQMFKCFSNSNW